jgi:hypothetical protein
MSPEHPDTPADLRPLAEELAALGEASRREGAALADRVAMRTAHVLREEIADAAPIQRLQRLLLWLAGPATVVAAALIGVVLLRPGLSPQSPAPPSVETLAANLEHDIDTWLELDAAWDRERFDNELALLSLEAAGVAVRDDDLASLPTIDADS